MPIYRKNTKMKPYEEIILSYIYTYHEINLEQLSHELGLNISIISDVLRELYKKKYFVIDDDKYYLTENSINIITTSWYDWSFSHKDSESFARRAFNWDFLYIPNRFDNI